MKTIKMRMKKLLSFATILLIGFYAQAQVIQTDDFELTFPAEPKIDEQEIVTEAGDTHLKMYQLMHNGMMILFTNATYPEGLDISTNKEVNKKVLKNSKNGSISNFAGQMGMEVTLVSEVFVEYKSLYGMRSIDRVGQYFGQVYTIAHLNKLYSILVFSENEAEGKEVLDTLVDSFSLKI